MTPGKWAIARYCLYSILVTLVLLAPIEPTTKALTIGVPAYIMGRRFLSTHGTSFRGVIASLMPNGRGRFDH